MFPSDVVSLSFFPPPLGHHSLYWTDGESKTKAKKDTGKGKGKKKKKKSNEHEALEDSDDGDYEGLEVDYMSDESRSDPFALLCTKLLSLWTLQCMFCLFFVASVSSM